MHPVGHLAGVPGQPGGQGLGEVVRWHCGQTPP